MSYLPQPTLSFTLPSLHDNTILDCRIYHPACLTPSKYSDISDPWKKKVAILAHPYAPLGGCYDDPVVGIIGAGILREGFIVATFNFRGAGQSKGRTSWSSKPERNDFMSVIGFLVHYMHYLRIPTLEDLQTSRNQRSSSEQNKRSERRESDPQLLLVGGYSYGALLAASLPPITRSFIHNILNSSTTPGSPQSEITLRAKTLALQQNDFIFEHYLSLLQPQSPPQLNSPGKERGSMTDIDPGSNSGSPTRKVNGGVRYGGKESKEMEGGRRSFSIDSPIRRSLDRVRSIAKHNRSESKHQELPLHIRTRKDEPRSPIAVRRTGITKEEHDAEGLGNLDDKLFQTAYLLISPPQGITGSFLTLWDSKISQLSSITARAKQQGLAPEDTKLVINPTLALFGDDDGFSAVKKYRAWAERLASASIACVGKSDSENEADHEHMRHTSEGVSSRRGTKNGFSYVEVQSAGHFWHDKDALGVLRREVRDFVKDL
ncbi:hypothetical protein F5884DRAFT_776389 [Xylogone sp. PMI_703]|nr:hypothetical protein F5884DRAFT_776389 [Xylogone sp. PMI_703]